MPSAANAKSEKPASSEAATDNSPVRQIMTVMEHKIRNLEKRKSKLTSYRDLQKAGKDLNYDQKVAVAKYDEVVQTLEFARDLSKQIASIAVAAEREAKKQAKREAWIRYASDTNKIREVLLVVDCLTQMGCTEVRQDFLTGSNGAAKLTEQDLKILDDLYSEVTPKHEVNEEGQPGFHVQSVRAAEHLYAIIDGKPKEVLGTTYTHIKEIINSVHQCGYFDKVPSEEAPVPEPAAVEEEAAPEPAAVFPAPPPAPPSLPAPPPLVPAPFPLPPITLQEVEHAYFAQQYPQQRPIAEVIGSQNFFFLQESEIDSPVGTPQPPPMMNQPSPPAAIPTQTFTNQHFVRLPEPGSIPLPPQPHFPPHPEHVAFAPVPMPIPSAMGHAPPPPPAAAHPEPERYPAAPAPAPEENHRDTESRSPEREDSAAERKADGRPADGQARFRRYGRGGGRGAPNGYRGGRGAFHSRQSQGGDYHGEQRDYRTGNGEQREYRGGNGGSGRQYGDSYRGRERREERKDRDHYYGNGDAEQAESGGRAEYRAESGGRAEYRARRAAPRPAGPTRGARPPRTHYARKTDGAE